MVQIAVIAAKKDYAEYIKKNLEIFFKPFAVINAYSLDDIRTKDRIKEKYVVISAYTIFKAVRTKISENTVLQTFTQTISKENIDKLKNASIKSKALLVNIDYRTCMQVITQLYEAGFQDIDFVPYFGNETDRDRSITTAVTPGELQLVPQGMETVVNIGDRVIDTNCIIELADKIGAKGIFDTPQAQAAKANILSAPWGIDRIFSENENADEKIKTLIEYIQDGVMITDPVGLIYMSNKKAHTILDTRTTLDGFGIEEILPGIDLSRNHENEKGMLLKIDGKNIITSNRAIYSRNSGKKNGNIITIRNYDELEDTQHNIRNRISGEKHVARFSFDDIKGSSNATLECIKKAKRFAGSYSSVLITGPSGVGKEVFAQSIHNASLRRKYNFVALNCAAIPENLLESELFGYDEGAFTGAKKGGKIGYFELAHKGTIFLDEIGEMPLALQSKLLRVIEERKFSRIGSSKVINIDIRIIAATNQDLEQLAEEKMFREDLFYRLNVLPLEIPPLSQRDSDAIELLHYFKEKHGHGWTLSEDVTAFLRTYTWPGNIREVRNLAEYFDSLEYEKIELSDLPASILNKAAAYANKTDNAYTDSVPHANDKIHVLSQMHNLDFILREGRNLAMHRDIMQLLQTASSCGKSLGRLQLENTLNAAGLQYSETEIRNCLRKLSESGYIKSKRGPGGSALLPKGEILLREIDELL